MVKVDSKETIRLLTKRFMRMNRSRNIIAVIAIMLTSLLFTSVFVGTQSLILSKRATDIRMFMNSSHVSVENLTGEEAERVESVLKANEDIKRFGTGVFLGSGLNKEFSFSAEVRYADNNMAESFNALPTTGRLPEQKNEIAVSTFVLDALGLPHKLGTKITLKWENEPEESRTDTFVVSGYYEGDKAILAQMVWVSKSFAEENQYPVTKDDIKNGNYHGVREYSVWYNNLLNLKKKAAYLSKEADLQEGSGFEVNPAYDLMEEDSFSGASVIVLVVLILLAGYLIIYNIFNISVKTDIRVYGLLKNVGITGRQLKRIVHKQALWLSLIGIPIGLLGGYITVLFMAPSLIQSVEISGQSQQISETVVAANPIVFIIAALLTLFTVYLSCLYSCHIVKKVSPIEALRIAQTGHTKKQKKRNTLVSWYGMAFQNMHRNWRMGSIVMLSIALSMVIVNCIVILVRGCDFDAFRDMILAADFQIDRIGGALSTTTFDGVDKEMKELLDACPDSETTGYIYYSEEKHEAEPQLMEILKVYHEENQEEWGDYGRETFEKLQQSNEVKVHLIGINKDAFQKLEWRGDACSWEKFSAGDAVLVDYCDPYSSNPVSYYGTGENFVMQYQGGSRKQYKVLGECMLPFGLDYPFADYLYITVFVPEEEYIYYTGNDGAMRAFIDAKKGQEKAVKQYLDSTVLAENSIVNVSSVLDFKASAKRYVNKFYMIGAILVIVLAFVGVMNYFNAMSTSILSRKKELALLEVVGMTKKQIMKMLIAEGVIYVGGAVLFAVVFVRIGAVYILAHTVGNAFFFQMRVTILPCICLVPVLLFLAVIIPRWQFKKMCTQSVVDRIRVE